MKIKAFSIAEISIVLLIIGVVAVVSLTVVRPFDRTTVYSYYNAYITLKNAAFNIKQDALEAITSDDSEFTAFDKRFANNAKELCQKLAVAPEAMNTKLGYINTSKYNCNAFKAFDFADISDRSAFDTGKNLAFQASNGMNFYILEPITYKQKDSLKNTETDRKAFLVLVDLNGKRRPNTISWKKSKPADIVPFLITSSGELIPLGSPTADKRYMTAAVKITENSKEYFSKTMTYREAQIFAFGNKEYPSVDTSSIRESLSSNAKLPKVDSAITLPPVTQDSRCKVEDGYVPPCTVEVDENTRV